MKGINQQGQAVYVRAGASPRFPALFRQGLTGEGVKELPEGRAENQLRTTGKKRNEKVFVTYFFGHIINTYSTTNFFSLDEERKQRGLYEVDMTGEFANLYINVQTLGEKVNVKLIMAMILEEVNFIVGHLHFTVVIFKTGFINDKTTVTHHVFAEIGFFAFVSTGNTEVRPHLAAFFHILFCEVGGEGGFTGAGNTEVQGEGNRFCFHGITSFESVDSKIKRVCGERTHTLFFC